jgi:hypothetical protein
MESCRRPAGRGRIPPRAKVRRLGDALFRSGVRRRDRPRESASAGGIAKLFKQIKKYVVSRSGDVETSWRGSVLLRGIADVKRLREEDGPSLVTQGSTELVHALRPPLMRGGDASRRHYGQAADLPVLHAAPQDDEIADDARLGVRSTAHRAQIPRRVAEYPRRVG